MKLCVHFHVTLQDWEGHCGTLNRRSRSSFLGVASGKGFLDQMGRKKENLHPEFVLSWTF